MPQLPLMQGSLSPYTGQEQRDIALRAATAEYQKYVNERRLKEALRAKSSLAMNCLYQPGDSVLIYRERSRLWDGSYSVVVQDGKIVTVKLNDNTAEQRFNVSSVKLYRLPETPNTAIQKQDQKTSLKPSPSDLEHPAVE
jgi:transcription elongation factor